MEETALVQSCKFDLLIQKIEHEKEKRIRYMEYEQKLRVIMKRIMSVYFFLTEKMDMPRVELSLEDFETSEEKIKGRWHKFWAKIGIKTAWQYYYKFGFFHYRGTPFGPWHRSSCNWSNWDSFNAEYIAIRDSGRTIPINALTLLKQIYEKEFSSQFKA